MLLGLMATFMIERNVEFQLEACKNEDVNYFPIQGHGSPLPNFHPQIPD